MNERQWKDRTERHKDRDGERDTMARDGDIQTKKNKDKLFI